MAATAGPAGAGGAHVTLLLRGGTYRLAEALQLGPGHSNLTIQNHDGEAVSISGAVPVNVTSKGAWSLANASTNTWKLDISQGQAGRLFPNYGLRRAGRRAILAKFPNGNPALSAVHMDSGSIPFGPGTYLPGSGRSEQIPDYFSRQHAPVNTTTEFWARPAVRAMCDDQKQAGTAFPPALALVSPRLSLLPVPPCLHRLASVLQDWPGTIWHEFPAGEKAPMDGAGGFGGWFHAQGGLCSGRQVDYGYWCSSSAPRSGGGKLQPPYNPPGGFRYNGTVLPQAGRWQNASGAVFHTRGGTNPYFSYMCLVDSVDRVTEQVRAVEEKTWSMYYSLHRLSPFQWWNSSHNTMTLS
eukprot:SAG22_NODE_53_length_24242_cov_158.884231_6_plen_353_part_00